MNKKLFSWKALAGLALLVAMGLTSCNNNTVVDPNDPLNTKTPTKPGTSTKDGDLAFTVTKSSDLVDLWNAYDATKKAELMKKTTLNIVVNSAGYKLDGGVITLPKFFNTTANSVLNLTFKGNFQDADKQPLKIDASTNLVGAKVNIVVPAQAFKMSLNATNVAATLASDGATINELHVAANDNKNNAVTINSGVTVKGINDASTGAILVNGGAINALIVNAAPTFETKKGFKVGSADTYVTSLIINTTGLTIKNDKDTPLGDITINKGCDVTLGFAGATVNSITGTKASESKVTLTGAKDDLKNIGALKNVTVANGGTAVDVKKNIFDGVVIAEDINLEATTLSGVETTGDINVNFTANNVTYTFNGIKIASSKSIKTKGGIEITLTPTKTTYQWDINNSKWVEVTASAPISAANASDTGIEVSSADVSVSAAGVLTDANNKVGAHKVITIVSGNKDYVQPENCSLVLDDKCTYAGAAIVDSNINSAVTWTGTVDPTWFNVKVGADTYTWKKGGSASAYYWLLVK